MLYYERQRFIHEKYTRVVTVSGRVLNEPVRVKDDCHIIDNAADTLELRQTALQFIETT